MMDLSLAEWLGVGGFFLSIISIGLTFYFENRRTKGKIKVIIKSLKKRTAKENCVVVFQVEIVNSSLEKRYIKSIYQHNSRGRFGLYFIKNEKNKNQIKRWYQKEEFSKPIALERGELTLLKYELFYKSEWSGSKVYFKFLVLDSLGKKYKSSGIYFIPNQLPEAPLNPGVMYL
ncbi:hypothetical protein FHS59_001189 [Algoriphagus iocasae]|uniref:Uncharacterized protein n=1 Tax=Algoriphagus iocasae TaxID=1836499 RepID=A0A841ML86_9BACT|nr:hypothetical protein [Algoriphagus iocasae]MBB6325574.1 hypothetical protein [Algoriphagus iocasae]